jgi:integrase
MASVTQSKVSPRRAFKGTVQIKVSNDRLQLVFSFLGKRHYLSLGLHDTLINRKVAEAKARQIELDMLSGYFDATLDKYRPEPLPTAVTPIVTPIEPPVPQVRKITPQELWQQYTAYKASQLKETTRLYHESFDRLFIKLGDVAVEEPLKVKAGLEQITTVHYTKRSLGQLSAACKWAMKHGILAQNPYEGMANEMPKHSYQLDPKPNAFTEVEREQVIRAYLEDDRPGFTYQHYAPIVTFLFLTGCRPSEAVGLQWKYVSAEFDLIRFETSITTSGRGKALRMDGSKTNRKRSFPCSPRLQKLLKSVYPSHPQPDDLVFPSPTGKAINYNNFCNNAWKRVVNLIKPGTTPYCCRDTFITVQILKGTPVMVIAQWCDTSVDMIQKHYAVFA